MPPLPRLACMNLIPTPHKTNYSCNTSTQEVESGYRWLHIDIASLWLAWATRNTQNIKNWNDFRFTKIYLIFFKFW